MTVLLAVELAGVRAPHERADLDAAGDGRLQQLPDGRAVVGQPLVGVTAPVGEEDPVPGLRRADDLDEAGEVVSAVHARHDMVARGPGALGLGEEPVVHALRLSAHGPRVDGPVTRAGAAAR